MICDWCGKKYPIGYDDAKNAHVLKTYANQPLVCNSCYEKIKREKVLKALTNPAFYQKIVKVTQ